MGLNVGWNRFSVEAHQLNAMPLKMLSSPGGYHDGNCLCLTVSDRDLKAGLFVTLCEAAGVIWNLALLISSALNTEADIRVIQKLRFSALLHDRKEGIADEAVPRLLREYMLRMKTRSGGQNPTT